MNSWIVRSVISPGLERVLGRPTFRYYREMTESQWWSRERLEQYQLEKLRRLLSIALNQTEGYAELAGMDKSWQPESLGDLRRLPLLDKCDIRQNLDRLVNHSVKGGAIRYTTGGSTGAPLLFYLDRRRQAYDKAARMLTHRWWGVRPGDREAYIWGSPVELSRQDRLKQCRDWLINDMLLPAFDLSETTARRFVDKLHRFQPACIFGYPSSIALLCQFARQANLRLDDLPVKAIFSTAEVLYDHQKQTISEAFGGVPVVNGYGSREGGFIAHECHEGGMHIIGENVIVEFVRDGRPVGPGEDAEIVVTHLDNYAMPFIRYRTNDIGQRVEARCACGRGTELMASLKGRSNDMLVARDGHMVHAGAVNYVMRDLGGLRQYQIVQEQIDLVRVRVVHDGGLPESAAQSIRDGIRKQLGGDVRVVVEVVEEIPPMPSGKHRYVVSLVAPSGDGIGRVHSARAAKL